MVFEILLFIAILATSFPLGLFLAWLCDDELVKDRKFFLLFAYFLLIMEGFLFIFSFNPSLIFSIAYLIIILVIMVRKGRVIEYENKFRKNKNIK